LKTKITKTIFEKIIAPAAAALQFNWQWLLPFCHYIHIFWSNEVSFFI